MMGLVLWLTLVWGPNGTPADVPHVTVGRQKLQLSLSGAFLEEAEVRSYLESGLTTSLLIRAQFRDTAGRIKKGAARVDLRYEPWDEVYFAEVWDLDGLRPQQALADREALGLWWRSLQLVVFRDKAGVTCRPMRVSLEVLPFSALEQNHAREWISEVGSGSPPGSPAAGTRGGADIELVNVLVATSMKRKPLMRFLWRVPCDQNGGSNGEGRQE